MSTFKAATEVAGRTATAHTPSTCPACHSASISSNAKSPDANSYWRCAACGEVWNLTRRDDARARAGGFRWR